MFKNWTAKDTVSIGVMLFGLVVWGARIESKLLHHESLPYHAPVTELIERRITEKVSLARAQDAAGIATLVAEIKHLRQKIEELSKEISEMRRPGKTRWKKH